MMSTKRREVFQRQHESDAPFQGSYQDTATSHDSCCSNTSNAKAAYSLRTLAIPAASLSLSLPVTATQHPLSFCNMQLNSSCQLTKSRMFWSTKAAIATHSCEASLRWHICVAWRKQHGKAVTGLHQGDSERG